MKAQKNNLKLAVMSMGFLFMFSCTGDVTGGSSLLNTSIFSKPAEKMGESAKQEEKDSQTNQIMRGAVIPFFFGTVEATLN
jgi:hypothetical protein